MQTHITIADLEEMIVGEEYHKMGRKMTICLLILKNGHEVVGHAAPVDLKNFDAKVGQTYAREDAVNKLWALAGYELQCRLAENVGIPEMYEQLPKDAGWCMCTEIDLVARDMKSTCSQCGGRDAYGTSEERGDKYKKNLKENT